MCQVSQFYTTDYLFDIYSKTNNITNQAPPAAIYVMKLFKNLNSFHPDISLTIEVNPKKFLDTKIVLNRDGTVTTFVYRKKKKFQYREYRNRPNVINGIP